MRAFVPELRALTSQLGYIGIGNKRILGNGNATGFLPAPDFSFNLRSGTIVPERSTATPVFTRAASKYEQDFEGIWRTIPSGGVAFSGMRPVFNLIPTPSTTIAVAANKTVSVAIGTYIFSMGAEATATSVITFTGTATGSSGTLTANATNRTARTLTITVAGTIIATCTVTAAVDVQLESVTGQSNQNPSEYVSVGVLSSPWHGSNIDGLKHFPYFNGNTVASNVVTAAQGLPINSSTAKFGILDGVSGNYFSTPDSVANSITGDIDIRVNLAMVDWTPAANSVMFSKLLNVGQYSFDGYVQPSGEVVARFSIDGTALTVAASTVSLANANGVASWVRITRASVTGTVTFYTSPDNQTWTQLGATVATTAGSIFNGTDQLRIGANAALPLAGNIYRAQIYNGINGTLAVDFNPNSYTSGATWPSTTGETWTINGNASVFGNGASVTNLCLQSQDFITTWAASNVTVSANTVTAPDGTTTADTITTTTTATTSHRTFQTITIAAVAHIFTVYIKPNGYTKFGIREVSVAGYYATFNTATTSVLDSGSGGTGAITALANGWYRVSMAFTAVAGANIFSLYTLDNAYSTGNPTAYTYTADGTSGVHQWGAQLETGLTASGYTPTTTVAVTVVAGGAVGLWDADGPTGYNAEPGATNLFIRARDFANAAWVKTAATVNATKELGPFGTVTAEKLEETAVASAHIFRQSVAKAASAAIYTHDVMVAPDERTWILLLLGDFGGTTFWGQFFNLSTGALGSSIQSGAYVSAATSTITRMANGFWRCTVTATSDAAAEISGFIYPSTNGATTNYLGVSGSGFLIEAANLKAGASTTDSPIDTTTIAVARPADNLSYTGLAISGAVTIAATVTPKYGVTGLTGNFASLSDGTANNYHEVYYTTAATVSCIEVTATATQANFAVSAYTPVLNTPLSVAYTAAATNDVRAVVNAGSISSDVVNTAPSGLTTLRVNGVGFTATGGAAANVASVDVYRQALTNAQLVRA